MIRWLLGGQGVYYLVTGLWPLISYGSFTAVTGPKTDDWLVRMVGLLAATIGAALLTAILRSARTVSTLVLSFGAAASFAAIDLIYVFDGRIAPIYLGDAAVELGLILLLAASLWRAEPRRLPDSPEGS